MHPSDLLPELFDIVVKQWTGRRLRPEQRAVIPSILVNCVGEAVLRRVQYQRHSGDRGAPGEDVTKTVTVDRFSDTWMPRREIVDTMGYASGLPRELAGLALTFIEVRVDGHLAGESPIEINGLGMVRSYGGVGEPPWEGPWRGWWYFAWRDFEGAGSWLSRIFGRDDLSQRLVEGWPAYEAARRPLSYTIELAPSLAIRKDTREARELDIPHTKANEFELAERRARPRDEEGALA